MNGTYLIIIREWRIPDSISSVIDLVTYGISHVCRNRTLSWILIQEFAVKAVKTLTFCLRARFVWERQRIRWQILSLTAIVTTLRLLNLADLKIQFSIIWRSFSLVLKQLFCRIAHPYLRHKFPFVVQRIILSVNSNFKYLKKKNVNRPSEGVVCSLWGHHKNMN